MSRSIEREYRRWCDLAHEEGIKAELLSMTAAEIEASFFKDLEFGTGGLRGVTGPGTNRMNVYTVAKASQGLANYLKRGCSEATVVIGYDSRRGSAVFSEVAASVFAANGIKVCIWDKIVPVPVLAFSVRRLGAAAGVMITASHNPAEYNGYKVYNAEGCQITTEAAAEILAEIEALDVFEDPERIDFDEGVKSGIIEHVSESVMDDYIAKVKAESLASDDELEKNVSIVYSPLNGTGYLPVTRVLREMGYNNVSVVEEQRLPDENFTTCPFPNPENREALEYGLALARKTSAELVLATDPDCDRVGIAVRSLEDYYLLSGNETGLLLFDYVCTRRLANNSMPQHPVMIKTIVTSELSEALAADYGVEVVNLLTGFKFIGEKIGVLEARGREADYIFGFEESYGYLSGTYVRDKDGVNAALLICEMLAYYKKRGITLVDRLNELYRKYGYNLNTLKSYQFEGLAGFEKMRQIMKGFSQKFETADSFAGKPVKKYLNYNLGIDGLPRSDTLKLFFDDGCTLTIRPSGTEPKIKIYVSVKADNKGEAEKTTLRILEETEIIMKK